jgi:hypothetical protein
MMMGVSQGKGRGGWHYFACHTDFNGVQRSRTSGVCSRNVPKLALDLAVDGVLKRCFRASLTE